VPYRLKDGWRVVVISRDHPGAIVSFRLSPAGRPCAVPERLDTLPFHRLPPEVRLRMVRLATETLVGL
jgi:hypothetical protein